MEFIPWISIILALPFMSLSMLYGSLKNNCFSKDIFQVLFAQTISIGLSIFIIYRLVKMHNITILNKKSEFNKYLMRDICLKLKYEIIEENDNFVVASVNSSSLKSDRYVYIVNGKDYILIKSITYGLNQLRLPFYWIADQNAVKRVKTKF